MKFLNLAISLLLVLMNAQAIKGADTMDKDSSLVTDSTFFQVAPIKGKVISPFGYRGSHNHSGTDIKLQKGDTVKAACCGHIIKAAPYSGYGNLVILKHLQNYETYYSHLSKCLVQEGDSVAAGDAVGLGGRTGRATTDHLHFEVRKNRIPQNSEKYFNFCEGTVKRAFYKDTTLVKTPVETVTEAPSTDDFILIQKGDTLYSLAKKCGMTVQQLQDLNNLKSTLLTIGFKLKIK